MQDAQDRSSPSRVAWLRVIGLLLLFVCIRNAIHTYLGYREYAESNLDVARFHAIASAIKALLFASLAFSFLKPLRSIQWLFGGPPFQKVNFLAVSLLLFVVLAPIIVMLNNQPYDVVADGITAITYFGYPWLSAILWIITAIFVTWGFSQPKGHGYRPVFWITALLVSPAIFFTAANTVYGGFGI